jgi:hypothetical protein
MKYYRDFTRSGHSFAERSGDPDEFTSAMGSIAFHFADMEEAARHMIVLLAGLQSDVGRIITAEMSFRLKLEVLGSLINLRIQGIADPVAREEIREETAELLAICQKSEDMRNTYFHSSYSLDRIRTKTTAKRKHGLRIVTEKVDSALLLDVADFICESAHELMALPLILQIADGLTDDGSKIVYSKDGLEVASVEIGR